MKFVPIGQQKNAIEHKDGPAVVFAGPGSGKTEVIGRRIAHLIQVHKVSPDLIVATTFTNKATDELRVRVREVLEGGPEPQKAAENATRIQIGTIHSLCYSILHEHGFFDEESARPVLPATEEEQILILQRNYRSFALDALYEIYSSQEDLSPGNPYVNFIKDTCSVLNVISEEVDRPGKEHLLDPTRIEDPYLSGVLGIYRKYREHLKATNRLDFATVQSEVAKLLTSRPDLARRIRNSRPYILVDEYQDTSPIQDEIFRAIYGPDGNIMIVGDDDQSIYGFRGADSGGILGFTNRFPSATKYILDYNRRSTPELVAATSALVAHNKERENTKALRALESAPHGEPPYFLPENPENVRTAAKWIKSLKEQGAISTYRQAAVLCRSTSFFMKTHRLVDRPRHIGHALESEGILHRIESDKGLLKNKAVDGIVALLAAASSKSAPASSQRAWMKLFKLIDMNKENGLHELEHWRTRLRKPHETKSDGLLYLFYEILDKYGLALPGVSPDQLRALAQFSELIGTFEEGRRGTAFQPPATAPDLAIDPPIDEADRLLLESVAAEEKEPKSWLLSRADYFLSFLQMLDVSTEPDPGDEYVLVTTIHKAKGLEFDAVVMLVNDPYNVRPSIRDVARAAFLSAPFSADRAIEEARRLQYVAATRARRLLLVVDTAGLASALIEELGATQLPTRRKLRIVDGKPPAGREIVRLSHGEVFSFRECPKRFQLEHEYGFVGVVTPPLLLGKALHRAIENLHRWQREKGQVPESMFEQIFRQTWPFGPGKDPKAAQKLYNRYLGIFVKYAMDPKSLGRPALEIERDLAVAKGVNVLTGKIDLVQGVKDADAAIIEIKLADNDLSRSTVEHQLNVYSLGYPGKDVKLEAVFLRNSSRRYEPPKHDQKRLEADISEVFERVRGKEFDSKPQFDKCRRCRVLRLCPEGKEQLDSTKKKAA